MSRGWHHQPVRHGLARRGIRTAGCKARAHNKPDTGPYGSNPQEIKREVLRAIQFYHSGPRPRDILSPVLVDEALEDPENEGTYEVVVDTLAAGQYGTHMPGIAADRLGLEIPPDAEDMDGEPTDDWDEWEWAWEEIEEKAGKIADALDEIGGLPGQFYFTNMPDYGDYILVYRWNRKDHPEFEYEIDQHTGG